MLIHKGILAAACAIVVLAASLLIAAPANAQKPNASSNAGLLNIASRNELRDLYRTLIEAENSHDIAAVRKIIWESPSTLFVAKTATPEEGNWAGFWGSETVLQHLAEIYKAGSFRIDPGYGKEKIAFLTSDVAETYVPANITVAYAGQTPVPRPFLMIIDWIRTPAGWRMATDIALPIPPSLSP